MANFALYDQGLYLGLDTDLTNRTSFSLSLSLSVNFENEDTSSGSCQDTEAQ